MTIILYLQIGILKVFLS